MLYLEHFDVYKVQCGGDRKGQVGKGVDIFFDVGSGTETGLGTVCCLHAGLLRECVHVCVHVAHVCVCVYKLNYQFLTNSPPISFVVCSADW